jgi:hypothetical protein
MVSRMCVSEDEYLKRLASALKCVLTVGDKRKFFHLIKMRFPGFAQMDTTYTENLYINGELFCPDSINGIISQSTDLAGTNHCKELS